MESEFAAFSSAIAAREVIAKGAGSFSAVVLEQSTDCVILISTGISHNTGACSQEGRMHIRCFPQRERGQSARLKADRRCTC